MSVNELCIVRLREESAASYFKIISGIRVKGRKDSTENYVRLSGHLTKI